MKKERQFLHDLHRRRVINLPFIKLFQNHKELRNVLFNQYLKTDLNPDHSLYLNSFFTNQEIEKGLIEANNRIPISNIGIADFIPQTDFEVKYQRISMEFYSLSSKMKIREEFCKHSIKETSLIRKLEIADTTIRDFNLYVTKKKEYNSKEYAEAWAKNLIHKLESINNRLLTELILRDFIQKEKFNEDRFDVLFDNKIEANSAKTKYRELLLYANNVINDYLKSLPPIPGQRIKALFKFINYLHSNIENFNLYNDLIKELELLDKERNKLSPENNYKDKVKYDKLQARIESKFKILQDNTANLIKAKANELNVCNFNNAPIYNFNGVEAEIRQLKKNFNKEDLPEILKHKNLYLDYRRQTHKTFLSLQFFFDELDEIAKNLFNYFTDTEKNEFETFETKAIPVNSITEAIQGFNNGQTKFILPTQVIDTKTRIQEGVGDFIFFQIEVIADLEFEGKTYKDIKQKNNDSILTPENWEQHKETFFSQRMATYKESYTLQEKIKLELSTLEKLLINKTDNQIIKDRYKDYLEQIKALPPQPIDVRKNRTKKVIVETFENMDKKGWEYAFTSEQDYNLFTDLLTNFFEYKGVSIPETVIQLKRGCKTKLAKSLGEIHKELSNENKLTTDTEYFKLIRVLSHFENEKQIDLYKALTR